MRCGVLWFVHVPKTGGSTVSDWLRRHSLANGWGTVRTLARGPYRMYDSGHLEEGMPERRAIGSALRSANATARQQSPVWKAIWRDAARTDGQPPRFVVKTHTGSLGTGSYLLSRGIFTRLAELLARRGCGLAVVTVVRDPVQRTASWAVASHVRRKMFRSLVARIGNAQSQYLWYGDDFPRWLRSPTNLPDKAFSLLRNRIAVCGVTDRMDAFLAEVASLLGWRASAPRVRYNVGQKAATPLFWENYSREDLETVENATWLDRQVYRACKQRWG
jgi:hypothetical protein